MFIIKYIQSFILILIIILATFIFGIVLIMLSWIDHKKTILNKCELYWGKTICYFSGLKINIYGYENIKLKRYIFCSNHSSALDIPISLSIINQPIVFLAKKQLFNIPFFGSILKSVGMIKVNRENKEQAKLSVDKAIKIIRESVNSILIYPEGTRNNDNSKLKPFKKGCFINDMQYCPYLKGAVIKKYNKKSNLRKPGNLMIINLMNKWKIKKKKSFMIGDQSSDKMAAIKSKLFFEYSRNNFYNQVRRLLIKFKQDSI